MDGLIIRSALVCKDGTTLSVQASIFHYCIPRDNVGPYTCVEVGYIVDKEENTITPPETWREYSSDNEFPTDVYGYVPLTLVIEFIILHGGIDPSMSGYNVSTYPPLITTDSTQCDY